jgi:hypothetical protein
MPRFLRQSSIEGWLRPSNRNPPCGKRRVPRSKEGADAVRLRLAKSKRRAVCAALLCFRGGTACRPMASRSLARTHPRSSSTKGDQVLVVAAKKSPAAT